MMTKKARVNRLTAKFFQQIKSERIKENVENYRKRDPSVIPNELHSILGTEVRVLNPELEEYYARYFKDRLKIVELSEAYEQTFVALEKQVEQYQKQLDDLKTQLDNNDAQISSASAKIGSGKG